MFDAVTMLIFLFVQLFLSEQYDFSPLVLWFLFLEQLFQFSVLMHRRYDVASSDEFTIYVELRYGWPIPFFPFQGETTISHECNHSKGTRQSESPKLTKTF